MQRFFLSFFFVLVQVLPTAAPADSSPSILIVGDSLSAGYGLPLGSGWVDLLQERLREKGYEHRTVNASISGDTTAGGLARLPGALERHDPELVVIELGGNDGLRALPLAIMRQNLAEMIEHSRAAGAAVALLGMRIPENYGPRYADGFRRIYRDLASAYEVPLVEFFMDGVALNPELMQSDGIHPNVDGQPVLLDNAWPAIEAALADGATGGAATAEP